MGDQQEGAAAAYRSIGFRSSLSSVPSFHPSVPHAPPISFSKKWRMKGLLFCTDIVTSFLKMQLPATHAFHRADRGAPEAKGSLSKRGQSVAKVKLKWRQSVDVSTLYLYFTLSRT